MEQLVPYRRYKEILRASFGAAFADYDVPVSREDLEEIVESTKRRGPHPETKAVLARLRERFRQAIFTNSDDDLISHNLRLIEVPIDYVITAEQAKAYKPSRKIFEYGHARMGVTKDEVVHVAMSMVLDIQACHPLGMRAIWINRLGETGNSDWLPYEELPGPARRPGAARIVRFEVAPLIAVVLWGGVYTRGRRP